MKIIEITNNVLVPITNEEADVLGKFHETETVERSKMSEREQQVANQLVNKDILLRKHQDGKTSYKKKIK